MARTIALVSCVAKKRGHPAAAKDLYTSPWFEKASRYASAVADDWLILSAEYGLVHKDDVIAPYEKTLKAMSAADRKAWGVRALTALRTELQPRDTVIILAGERYREQIIGPIRGWGRTIPEDENYAGFLKLGESRADTHESAVLFAS